MEFPVRTGEGKRMTLNALKSNEIDEANRAYAKLVTGQVTRVTNELLKLEQLLKAGMVDSSVLKDFRQAVDQVRKTSWSVEQMLQSGPRT
jgi:hypothetical protein